MIYTMGWEGLTNYKSLSNSRNTNRNLDKPSYPNKIRRIIPGLVSDLQQKNDELLRSFPWLNSTRTTFEVLSETIKYANENYGSKTFTIINLGRFDTESNIWSWSWTDIDNNFLSSSKSMMFKDYGSNKNIEVLTKAMWYTTKKEKIEVVALCAKLVSSVGLEIQVKGGVEHFYLLSVPTEV
jgi:hypothetical protein